MIVKQSAVKTDYSTAITLCTIQSLQSLFPDLEVNRDSYRQQDTHLKTSGTVTSIGLTGELHGYIEYVAGKIWH